jgi:hypothetical protein
VGPQSIWFVVENRKTPAGNRTASGLWPVTLLTDRAIVNFSKFLNLNILCLFYVGICGIPCVGTDRVPS